MVNVPFDDVSLPASATLPMSPPAKFPGGGGGGGGGGGPLLLTLTLSNTAVVSTPLLWLVTARPSSTVGPIVTVSMPTTVQLTPSLDTDPVKVLPERTSF